MRISIQSLGCPKNFVDSEVIAGYLLKHQYTITNDLEQCDIALINTCSFIEPAVEESIDNIIEAINLKKEGKIHYIMVAGCLPQRYNRQELVKSLPEIDAFIGIDQIPDIADILKRVIKGEKTFQVNLNPSYLYNENSPRFLFTPGHYAYIKIAEGCNNACTYCLIPHIKGPYRSRTIESVFLEARSLVDRYPLKEIILIAEDTTYYGKDLYGELSLAELLKRLTELNWSRENRIRILYTHPAHFNDKLINCLAENELFCPYLDIPLQHINNSILKRMNRKIGKDEIITLIEKLRRRIPDLTLRTTFVVGFPGESDADFQELCDFVQDYKFEKVGVFKYYNEADCYASKYPEQVPERVKKERLDRLLSIQQKIALTHQERKIGKKVKVLVDGFYESEGKILAGRSCAEAPEIDGNILILNGKKKDIGNWVEVEISKAYPYHLESKIRDK